MVEYFTGVRKKHHRHLELRLRSNYTDRTALGNPENFRQGINKMLGYAASCAGVPFPSCDSVEVAEDGPAFSLNLKGEAGPFFRVFASDDGNALYQLALELKLRPTKFFGTEQALSWVEEFAQLPPFRELLDRALAALEDPTGYASISKI